MKSVNWREVRFWVFFWLPLCSLAIWAFRDPNGFETWFLKPVAGTIVSAIFVYVVIASIVYKIIDLRDWILRRRAKT